MAPKKYSWIEYLAVIAIWLLIFGIKVFSGMLFVDYGYSTFFDFFKILYMGDFAVREYLFYTFNGFLSIFNLQFIAFQASILIAMFASFYFIKKLVKKRLYSLLFALIYFFNPFVYSRIMVGQLGVLLAYLTLPIYIYFLFSMFERKFELRSVILCVIAYTIVAGFAPHFFAINLLIFVVGCFWLVNWKDKEESLRFIKSLALFILFLFLLNLFWLQGFFSNPVFSVIDQSHETFFSPKLSQDVPSVAKIIGMYGFWREPSYLASYHYFPLWFYYPMLITIVALFLAGKYSLDNKRSSFFFTLFWVGLVFGAGASHPYTKPIFDSFFNFVPFFNGFRDSHKFVSLIALAYAYLVPISIIKLNERLIKKRVIMNLSDKKGIIILKKGILNYLLILIFIIFILLFTFPLINFNIKPVEYPESYFKVAGFIDNSETNGYIIYLPWQNYLTYNWTESISRDGRTSVPINKIIKKEVLIGADAWGAESLLSQEIKGCVSNQSISCLQENNVEYVLKDKCAHYPDNYPWITPVQSVIPMVYENECFEVYDLGDFEKIEKKVPLRFIIGSLVSLITLCAFVYLLSRKEHKKPE